MSRNRILPIAISLINANTFNGTYLPINSGGLPEACSIIRIVNDSDQDVAISYDGTNGHDYLRSGETLQLDFQSNRAPANEISKLGKGTVVYVLAAVGTGFVYLSGYYQPLN